MSPRAKKYFYYYRDGVREQFSFEDLVEYKIPVPNISVQNAISDIFDVYNKRKQINKTLKLQISEICSVLIKGSLNR